MRNPFPALLAVGLVPALVLVPTVTTPKPAPRPVAPHVQTIVLHAAEWAAPGRAGAGSGPEVLTAPLSADTFQLVGVTWASGQEVGAIEVSVRVHGERGWSDWQPMEVMDIGPAPSSAEARASGRTGTEPLITDPSDGIQIKVDTVDGRVPSGLKVSLIDPGTSSADAHLADLPPASSAQASASTPKIISRAAWGADERLRNGAPRYGSTIKVGFVHHTATSNNYSGTAGAAAQIRSIYAYDTNVLGWSDIAYNFLVDKAGNIYEGRYGGIDKAVIGAHTAGFNDDTFAVSALGCFDSSCSSAAKPSSAMLTSIADVMGWKLGLFHVDPLSQQTLVSNGIYGTNTRYPAGTKVSLQAVSMHRDVGSTACPGNYLKDYVHSTIANAARAAQGAEVWGPSLSPKVTDISERQPVTVTARTSQAMAWTLAVVDSHGTTLRSFTGSTTSSNLSIKSTWDLTTKTGSKVGPGVYELRLSATSPSGSATPWVGSFTVRDVERLAGAQFYDTSVIAARTAFPSNGSAVVIASGEQSHLVDGIVAAPFAYQLKAPVLLTNFSVLPAPVTQEIKRRGSKTAYLIGGPKALSPTLEGQLKKAGITTIKRFSGTTQYHTAALVARAMPTRSSTAFIASGAPGHLIDGSGAGGPAARLSMPILLTDRDYVPAETKQALKDLGITKTIGLGGKWAISVETGNALGLSDRLAGDDAVDTSLEVAGWAQAKIGDATIAVSAVETGHLVDTLPAGTLGRVIVLTSGSALDPRSASWIRASSAGRVYVMGGENALSDVVVSGVYSALVR